MIVGFLLLRINVEIILVFNVEICVRSLIYFVFSVISFDRYRCNIVISSHEKLGKSRKSKATVVDS